MPALLQLLALAGTVASRGLHADASGNGSSGHPTAARLRYESLDLGYSDFKRVLTRPLLHLEPDGLRAEHPRLYISSAFLVGGNGWGE